MSRRVTSLLVSMLAAYTLILLGLELTTSQEKVRVYYTDIQGDIAFYGVNTSLSAALLWSVVIIFAVCTAIARNRGDNKCEYNFYFSQVAVFSYLTFDERFQVHDKGIIVDLMGPYSDLILIIVGLIEVILLWKWGNILKLAVKTQRYLLIASILFTLMMIVDAFFPQDLLLRLSLEDLLKTWSNVFFFFFAWSICTSKIKELILLPVLEPVLPLQHKSAECLELEKYAVGSTS